MKETDPEVIGKIIIESLAKDGFVSENSVFRDASSLGCARYDFPGSHARLLNFEMEERVSRTHVIKDMELDVLLFRLGKEFFSEKCLRMISEYGFSDSLRKEAQELLENKVPLAIKRDKLSRGIEDS